jgi:predicted RecB family nuclease
MQLRDGQKLFSATDLVDHLSCPHLTKLKLERLTGTIDPPPERVRGTAELAAEKGTEHEAHHLARFRERFGEDLVVIEGGRGPGWLEEAAARTREAMVAGAPLIYQASFLDPPWMGHADFIEKVEEPSSLGGWSYIPIDTKLARSVKPYFVVQLCTYAALIEGIQGVAPQYFDLVLGDGTRASLRHEDFRSYFAWMRSRFIEAMATGPGETYPEPVEHCEVCDWAASCEARWVTDDHLTQVANLGRAQARKLIDGGVTTVADLAVAEEGRRPRGMSEGTFESLRSQAALQVEERLGGERALTLLEPSIPGEEPPRGFALLPRPDEGDLFFDIEGDPFYEDGGLEYLWGVSYFEDGALCFRSFWGLDRTSEKRAFEEFVDLVIERRRAFPGMHVYHYAPYERTALGRMMGRHGSREEEVDRIFREGMLVDLYRVVAQSMRISRPSYSLKEVEHFYGQGRDAEVKQAGDSVLMFEEWLDSDDGVLLDQIEAYNKEDCDSTAGLREWLLERRLECADQYEVEICWREPKKPDDPVEGADPETDRLRGLLLDGVPEDPDARSGEEADCWLLAQLLDYHRRDAKPGWWEFFDRLTRSELELIEQDSEAIGGLRRRGDPEALPPPARSWRQSYSFPSQEHKVSAGKYLDPGSCGVDPQTGESDQKPKSVEVEAIDDQGGTLTLRLSEDRLAEEQRALIPGGPIAAKPQQAALRSVATEVTEKGLGGVSESRPAVEILRRSLPRSSAVSSGSPLQGDSVDLDELAEIVEGLEGSYLFVQGPPGSGKTFTGAELIARLIESGRTVGVSATSHKAINNLLAAVEAAAKDRGTDLRGLKKSGGGDQDYVPAEDAGPALIGNSKKNGDFEAPADLNLMAGTAWLWSREGMRRSVDHLFIDEAGQISLADALAVSTAAENVVLLGDPLQLGQVSQGTHPGDSGASVLEHLLGGEGTIGRARGVFLDRSRRMHPDICRFVSAAIYEDRLGPAEHCERQRIDAAGRLTGSGIRSIGVSHIGNTRQSPEEAEVIVGQIESLAGADVTDRDGVTSALRQEQILVVTPYNSQVRCLREHLDRRGLSDVRAGTVDKFQGQQGAVVFFSMATSSGAEVPRNVEFLFSRNRLNVAVSRAQCLAVLVASPELLGIECKTVEQMRLINALCLLDSTGRAAGELTADQRTEA